MVIPIKSFAATRPKAPRSRDGWALAGVIISSTPHATSYLDCACMFFYEHRLAILPNSHTHLPSKKRRPPQESGLDSASSSIRYAVRSSLARSDRRRAHYASCGYRSPCQTHRSINELLDHAICPDQRDDTNQHLIHHTVLSLGDELCLSLPPGQRLDEA